MLGWLTQGLLPAVCLDSSLTACSGVESTAAPQKLLILDARSYTAAVANRAKGGGCECEGMALTTPATSPAHPVCSQSALWVASMRRGLGAACTVERARQTWLGIRTLPLI